MKKNEAIYQDAIRVNFFECDFNRNWKPAAFFQHLTETAGLQVNHLGCGFNALAAQDLTWVHARMKIRFFHFPQAGERIYIRTWPKTIQQKLFYIRDFEILQANSGDRLAAATSAWLMIHIATRKIVPPASLNLNLPELNNLHGLDETLDKLRLTQTGEKRSQITAGYSAVDGLGHVNNSRYVEWICDAIPMDMHRHHRLDWMQVNYNHEVLAGEEIALFVNEPSDDSNPWTVEGSNLSNNTRAFESALYWHN